jgi:N-methylhydantoinase A
MRFRGQKHSLRVPFEAGSDGRELASAFIATYLRKYGHVDEGSPVDIIGLRVTAHAPTQTPDIEKLHRLATGPAPAPRSTRSVHFAHRKARFDTPVYRRDELPAGFQIVGPVVVEEFGSTMVVGPGEAMKVGRYGEIEVTLSSPA